MITEKTTNNYFYKLLKGETSLLIVFWFWFIFISFMIEVYFETSFIKSSYAGNKENFTEYILYFIISVYAFFIFLIIFKTANNYQGLKIWSFFAKVIVTINLFFSFNFFIEINKFYFFEDYAMQKEIESFKKSLPIQVDMNSTLVDIYKEDKTIHYKYQLIEVFLEDQSLKNKFKKQIQDSLCEDESTLDLLKRDYTLDYLYINEKDEEMINIKTDKKACGDSIYDLDILNDVLQKQGII